MVNLQRCTSLEKSEQKEKKNGVLPCVSLVMLPEAGNRKRL